MARYWCQTRQGWQAGNKLVTHKVLEPVEDVAVVPLDGVRRQEQPLPDLLVRLPVDDEPQPIQFALAQWFDQRPGTGDGGGKRAAMTAGTPCARWIC